MVNGFKNQLITGGHHLVVMLNYQRVDYIQLGFDPSMNGRWLIYFSRPEAMLNYQRVI